MSRREVSRLRARGDYRAIRAPESGADLVPPATVPVPGRPGGTDSIAASLILSEAAGSRAIYFRSRRPWRRSQQGEECELPNVSVKFGFSVGINDLLTRVRELLPYQ